MSLLALKNVRMGSGDDGNSLCRQPTGPTTLILVHLRPIFVAAVNEDDNSLAAPTRFRELAHQERFVIRKSRHAGRPRPGFVSRKEGDAKNGDLHALPLDPPGTAGFGFVLSGSERG